MFDYLLANENTVLFSVVVGTFLLSVLWEAIRPRRPVSRGAVMRWGHNIGLSLVNQVVVYWADAAAMLGIAWWASRNGDGLLTRLDVSFPVALVVTTLSFELLMYTLHRLMHQVGWLWRIHTVHHSDTELDFTTTYRNHPFEVLIVMAATMPLVALLGPPVLAVLLYQIARVSVNIMAHSNVYLPEWIDRWLRYLIVTPDFHRCHHSDDRRFTNSNYGAFLPLFDYLFRSATRKPFDEQASMTVGLEYFRDPKDSRFDRLLTMPFRRRPDETVTSTRLAGSSS